MKKYYGFALAAIGLAGLSLAFQAAGKTEIVSLPKTAAFLETAARLGLDLLAERDGRIFIVAPPADLRKIEDNGLSYRKETERFAPAGPAADSPLLASPIGAFHTHQELEDDLVARKIAGHRCHLRVTESHPAQC